MMPPLRFPHRRSSSLPRWLSAGALMLLLASGARAEVATSSLLPFARWGPVDVRPHLLYRHSYNDGLQVRPGQSTTTRINALGAGVLFDLGGNWSVDYSAMWTRYSSTAFRSTVDHSVDARGKFGGRDWGVSVGENYVTTSSSQVETARQTRIEQSNTVVDAMYHAGPHLSFSANATQRLSFVEATGDTFEWTTTELVHYSPFPVVHTSAGLEGGYVAIYRSPDMQFVRPQAQVTWSPTDKLQLSAHGGIEWRESLGHGRDRRRTPIYSATANYLPFEHTTLTLSFDHVLSSSLFFRNQVVESTKRSIELSQQLFGRLQLSGGLSAQKSDYVAAAGDEVITRRDDTVTRYLRVGTAFLERGSIAISYRYTRNDSDLEGFNAVNREFTCEIAFRF